MCFSVSSGSDAILLGAETLRGLYPVETISTVGKICAEVSSLLFSSSIPPCLHFLLIFPNLSPWLIKFPSAGREGFQLWFVLQKNCQICRRCNEPFGVYYFHCGIFIMFQFSFFAYLVEHCLHSFLTNCLLLPLWYSFLLYLFLSLPFSGYQGPCSYQG